MKILGAFFLSLICYVSAQPSLTISPPVVTEGGSLQACVNYDPLPTSATTVVVATRELVDDAIAVQDFESVLMSFDFGPASSIQQCVDISTVDDNALEGFEQFEVVATLDSIDIDGSPANVLISNTDTSVEVGFSQESYSFNEEQSGTICVLPLNGGSVETISGITITLSTSDGTAVGGEDFDNVGLNSRSITINRDTPAEGDCFPVLITDDTLSESEESFTITLQPGASYTVSSSVGTTTINIVDNDDDCAITDPPMLDNGSFLINNGRTAADYTCDNGYTGGSSLSCTAGSSWSPLMSAPCDPVVCPALSDPDNGAVATPQLTFTSIATYSCDSGYYLNGDSTRTCQADTTWSGAPPTCIFIECPDLPPPDNGAVSQPSNTSGAVATYSCSEDYNIVGSETRMCGGNSIWSGEEPTCISINVGVGGQLSQDQVTGLIVGLVVGLFVLVAVIVVVVIVAWWCCVRSKRNEKYTLNYSTTYGDQRKASDPGRNAYENVNAEAPLAGNGEKIEMTEQA